MSRTTAAKKPDLKVVPDGAAPPAPVPVAQQVKTALAEADRLVRHSITEYAAMLDAVADKAAEIAELGKHAPGNIAPDAALMADNLRIQRDSVMSILQRGN